MATGTTVIEHVRQQDQKGCLVACIAMVTGRSYEDVRAWFHRYGQRFDGQGGGLIHLYVQMYLGEHGYASILKYRWLPGNALREAWPCEPFAPAHIVGVNGAGSHGVVLLSNGVVLDPAVPQPLRVASRLSDYSEVGWMLGVWSVDKGDRAS